MHTGKSRLRIMFGLGFKIIYNGCYSVGTVMVVCLGENRVWMKC